MKTKKERRQDKLNRHYAMLEKLAGFIGVNPVKKGVRYSCALLKLERGARQLAAHYCNGTGGVTSDNWEEKTVPYIRKVQALFGGLEVPGLFVNGDARGHALKIDDAVTREVYPDYIGIQRDWGGYGILSPDMDV